MTADQATAELQAREAQLRRRYQPREVATAVERAFVNWTPRGEYRKRVPSSRPAPAPAPAPPVMPTWNSDLTARIHEDLGFDTASLWDVSPHRIEGQDADWYVDRLFPADCLLCVGKTNSDFKTAPREWFRGRLHRCQLIVPACMTTPTGTTQDGRTSAHSKANTGPRRYLVCDFDDPPPELHASILMHLSLYAPLVLILSSGGKSLHGWFAAGDDEAMQRFFRYAARCGADPALWRNPSQFVRLPEGRRDNGRRQRVWFFDPDLVMQ